MAKIADVREVAVSLLKPYGNNAKIHSEPQIEKLKDSIMEFGFLSPCLIDADYNIIAGHGRVLAAKSLGMQAVPCVFVEGLSDEQRRAYILADNRLGELGEWDMSIVLGELADLNVLDFDVELTGFDLPEDNDWFETRERFDNSRQEGNEEYNAFLDKFEQPKTTDDCYTPENIYNIVAGYVEEKYGRRKETFVRPFYPGGNYQEYNYAPGSVVVDNPPFSILAEIVDFYIEKNQPFFIFSPGLSTLGYVGRDTVTALCVYAPVTYENGANVPTSFITNLGDHNVAAISDPDLCRQIDEANEENLKLMKKHFPKYEYPMEVLTAAKMGYLSKYGQRIEIKRSESVLIRQLDAQKEADKVIYGSALLLSERAAAERAAATTWQLSERELEIVRNLG